MALLARVAAAPNPDIEPPNPTWGERGGAGVYLPYYQKGEGNERHELLVGNHERSG
jgi:hypothetical protein